ncbi:hypothetical protein PRK78_004410 [Emydomyces testavorans]|uniref:Uncharacterized protein n=1 Tax=Emydomyces testavorans TaxID=2070801 RepID=A0AAF0DJV4_9EURO|nr:hypothetical protein PRK78_004410 [Emydomyces testavorans]
MAEPIRSRPPSILLEPPPKGVELEDPGAQDSGKLSLLIIVRNTTDSGSSPALYLAAESDEEHFSDASEGRNYTQSLHIHIPSSEERPNPPLHPSLSPGDSPIPRTVVEKVSLNDTRYGEEPGTPAYEARKMDAVPDLVYKVGKWDPESPENAPQLSPKRAESPLPETKLSRVDSPPDRATSLPSFTAHKRRLSDALPDIVETVPDTDEGRLTKPGTVIPPENRNSTQALDQNTGSTDNESTNGFLDGGTVPFGDDFDEFKEAEENTEQDDFGDFDNEFQEASPEAGVDIDQAHSNFTSMESYPLASAPLPLLHFDSLDSLSDLLTATSDHLDILFPKSANLSTLPPVEPIPDSSALFNTERSLSLWSQLVAPPPLQPPNWTKSRIRRLFLVSLGVPVDLDEILPASKQKKLVLPSITTDDNTARKPHDTSTRSLSHPPKKSHERSDQITRSSTSTDAPRSESRNRSSRQHRGQRRPPPPELDLSAVRRLCATTDAALDGLTDEEMRRHVENLEEMSVRASEVLEYWLKRRDGQLGEKEAYDGVIENLVKHARQVRS